MPAALLNAAMGLELPALITSTSPSGGAGVGSEAGSGGSLFMD